MEFDKLVVSLLVDEIVGGFFISVPPGHIACIYDRGSGVLPRVWGPGLHLKIPFWHVAKLFNAQVLEYSIMKDFDLSLNRGFGRKAYLCGHKDGKDTEGSVLFRIDRFNAPEIWENLGENVVSKVVRPFSRSRIASIFGDLTLDQIKNQRSQVENVVKEDLGRHFKDRGLECEGFLLSEIRLALPRGKEETILQAPPSEPVLGLTGQAVELPIAHK
jgi:regulator of protease activity HflC (stomatin/prohibitin superfamily)